METILAISSALDVSVGELQGESSEDDPSTVRSEKLRATSSAPTGHVALVFSDIQGSTPLWERDPLMMRRAMIVHNTVLRRLIERQGGYEVKPEGDAFMIAFRGPVAAIEFCLLLQDELLEADWPAELSRHPEAAEIRDPDGALIFRGLRVRMGVHVGDVETETDPVTGRADYYGRVVNCASRLVQAAHGGQVLVSRDAWSFADGQISAEAEDLGEVRLRGMTLPLGLIQVHPPTSHRRTFPPPLCDGAKRTNLVPARTSLVGRIEEIGRISGWLRADRRLVTLVGPGGAGKTRLGRAVGAAMSGEFSGGVWLVELAPAKSLEAAIESVAEALSLELGSAPDVEARVERIGNALFARGTILLILDNVEHLVTHLADAVGRWLKVAPDLRIVVTSQHHLAIEGEQICPVSGLTPTEAVQLFVERAQQACPLLALSSEGEVLVREIVGRLERLPLAIELAAARMKVLSLSEIRDRLAARFTLLSSGPGDALARHATLRSTIEWSFSLLKPYEQIAVVDLARLPGSFDITTAEAVLDLNAFTKAPSKLDVVQSLLEKSLLWASDSRESADDTRLRLYESVRAFALEQPSEVGPRLVAWAVSRGEALVAQWDAKPCTRIAKQLVMNLENYNAALDAAADDNPDAGLRIWDVILTICDYGRGSIAKGFITDISVCERLWNSACRSPELERRALCRRARLRSDPWNQEIADRDLARMEQLGGIDYKVLGFKSIHAERRCAYEEAWDYAERSVAASAREDAWARYWSIANLALLAVFRELRPPDVARSLLAEMLSLAQSASGPSASILTWVISLEMRLGNPAAALKAHEELARELRAQGRSVLDLIGEAADIYFDLGRFEDATQAAEVEQQHARMVGNSMGLVCGLETLGSIHCAQRRDDEARPPWEEGASMPAANPGRAFCCEVKLLLLDILQDTGSVTRLDTFEKRPQASRPDMARMLAALKAFLAARAGDPDRAEQFLERGNKSSAWGGPPAWNSLVTALTDVANAAKLRNSGNLLEACLFQQAAQEKLRAAPAGGDVALLARLVERALNDFDHSAAQ